MNIDSTQNLYNFANITLGERYFYFERTLPEHSLFAGNLLLKTSSFSIKHF